MNVCLKWGVAFSAHACVRACVLNQCVLFGEENAMHLYWKWGSDLFHVQNGLALVMTPRQTVSTSGRYNYIIEIYLSIAIKTNTQLTKHSL